MKDIDEVGIVYPQVALPGALAIAASNRNMPCLRLLQGAGPTLYTVKAVVGTHIPLIGTIESIVALSPETGLSVHKPPLSMYLHSGGRNAVFLDLTAKVDGTLSTIDADIDADSPAGALAGMRSAVNQFLDVLMRKLWLPLVFVRLDLYVGIGADSQLVAHELQVPFVGTMQIGPIGGIHQYPLFSELESLAREGICSTSPFYRFLCAYRLYEGTGALRTQLRQMCKDASIIEPLPKDTKVDHSFLEAMGIDGLTSQNIRTVGDLHGKFTELRNMVAHFILTKGEKLPPLHISDGYSYRAFSNAAAVLLHYSVDALTNLSSFFQKHLSAVVSIGSVLPMQSQREKHRIVVRSIQKANKG